MKPFQTYDNELLKSRQMVNKSMESSDFKALLTVSFLIYKTLFCTEDFLDQIQT